MTDTVLITGASGFTGPYMAHVLASQGLNVVGTSLSGRPLGSDFSESFKLDLSDKAATFELMEHIRPDYIVHLAGISYVGHADLAAFYSANVVGAEHLFSAAIEAQLSLKSILVASSANIYGTPNIDGAIDESISPHPINHYAISKLSMEFVARKFMEHLPIVIARPFNYIGYGQSLSFVVPKIVSTYAQGLSNIDLGSIDVFRDFTDVRDTTDAYKRMLLEPKCVGEVFNVCSGNSVSVEQILGYMRDISGIDMNVSTNPLFVRKHEIKKLQGSNKKVCEYTNWSPHHSMKDTLADMYQKFVANLER